MSWFPYLHPKPMYAFEVEMMRAVWSEPPTVFPISVAEGRRVEDRLHALVVA